MSSPSAGVVLSKEMREKLTAFSKDLVAICNKHGIEGIDATVTKGGDDVNAEGRAHDYRLEWQHSTENRNDPNGAFGGVRVSTETLIIFNFETVGRSGPTFDFT